MHGYFVLRCFFTFAVMLLGACVVLENCLVMWLVVHRGFDRVENISKIKEKTFEKLKKLGLQLPKKIQKETSETSCSPLSFAWRDHSHPSFDTAAHQTRTELTGN